MPQHQTHTLEPVFDAQSRVLVLGSFPSPLSRQTGFYYGNPHNRFWSVMSALWNEPVPSGVGERRDFALRHRVALWDVIAECEITGSSDSSIKNVVPNDINLILTACDIRAVFVNGRTAEKYYIKYAEPFTGIKAVCLPSTSPANAAWSLERLCGEWEIITKYF